MKLKKALEDLHGIGAAATSPGVAINAVIALHERHERLTIATAVLPQLIGIHLADLTTKDLSLTALAYADALLKELDARECREAEAEARRQQEEGKDQALAQANTFLKELDVDGD